jgi:hypothetical protein
MITDILAALGLLVVLIGGGLLALRSYLKTLRRDANPSELNEVDTTGSNDSSRFP